MEKIPAGKVIALYISVSKELRKVPRDNVGVYHYGFVGDRHAGVLRKNSKGAEELNDRQVSILAKEVVDTLNRDLGIAVPPGGLGENILVEGMGDLSQCKGGEYLKFGSGVILEVKGQNQPCAAINRYHPQLVKRIYGRRGIVTIVRRPGIITTGESVEVLAVS